MNEIWINDVRPISDIGMMKASGPDQSRLRWFVKLVGMYLVSLAVTLPAVCLFGSWQSVKQEDKNTINLYSASPESLCHCALLRNHRMWLLRRNRNVNMQYLYLITATMAPSISIKALTPGSKFYFVLKVCRRLWKCHCAYAPLHYLMLHIYFTGDECLYLKGDFPAGEISRAVSSGGVWTNMAAWGLFYVSS